MDPEIGERRLERRLPGSTFQLIHATLRPGRRVVIIDISQTGAQIETERPLRPGTRAHLRLVGEHWSLAVAAVVLRCVVWTLHPEGGVTYRGGLQFEARCHQFEEVRTGEE
jgi:PilZ domain